MADAVLSTGSQTTVAKRATGRMAFAFVNLSVPRASMRDEMTELYNHCLEQLSSADPHLPMR